MKCLYSILFVLVSVCLLPAQTVQQDWEQYFGDRSDEVVTQLLEASNGTLVAVGYTESAAGKSRDGLVLLIDTRTGQKIRMTNYGGSKDERFDGVAQTNRGTFLLAGSTESKGSGKQDGWLVEIDANGQVIDEQTFGTGDDDRFLGIAYHPEDEHAYLVGQKAGGKNGAVWVVKYKDQQVAWDKSFGNSQYRNIKGVSLAGDGIAIAGTTDKSRQRDADDIYLMKVNVDGDQSWVRYFGDRDYEEAGGLIRTADGDFVIAGTTNSFGAGRLDAWLLRTDSEGYQKWNRPFGGRDDDEGLAVSSTFDDGFLLVGRSRSHAPNARTTKSYVVKVDAGGTLEWQRYYGGNRDDEATAAFLANDGRLLVGGAAQSAGAGGKDGWVFALRDASTPSPDMLASAKSAGEMVQLSPVVLHTHDQKLKPNDQTYLSLRVQNTSQLDLPNLNLRVQTTSGAKGVDVWETNYLGKLEAQSPRTVRIPVKANDGLQSGKVGLRLQLVSGNVPLAESAATIEAKKPVPAKLEIANYQFKMMTQERGASFPNIRLTVDMMNTGDYSTNQAIVQLGIPQGLEVVAQRGQLGTVPPGGRATAVFEFRRTPAYRDNRATVFCVLRNQGQEQSRQPYTIDLNNPAGTTAGGPALASNMLIWTEPNQDEVDINNITTQDPEFSIRSTIVSNQRIRMEDVGVYVNENALEGNKELDEELIAPKTGFNTYTYRRRIRLKEGENVIQIKINEIESRTIRVTYTPRSRNLHVVSIGPQHVDLKYTSKDARDFANAFKNQEGRLFERVFLEEFTQPENTTRESIQKAILDLENRFRNGEILENDVLVVFISSHGVVGTGDRFKLLPTGYDPRYGDRFTIDYQTDVLNPLNQIGCKKLIMLDACHSGASGSRSATAADTRRSEMVNRINASAPGLSTLASCKSFEMSYEDESWQNGAFTEAILEALQNKKIMDRDGNIFQASPDDNFLTVSELYTYVQRRVAQLVSQYKPDAPTAQTPFMSADELNLDLPLFEVTQQ